MAVVEVDVVDRGVGVALTLLRSLVDGGMGQPLADVGEKAVRVTQPVVPTKSGQLVASLKARQVGQDVVEVVAGSGSVVYAGVQNYGWPGRNIAAQPFLPTAGRELAEEGPPAIESEIQSLIRRVGLD